MGAKIGSRTEVIKQAQEFAVQQQVDQLLKERQVDLNMATVAAAGHAEHKEKMQKLIREISELNINAIKKPADKGSRDEGNGSSISLLDESFGQVCFDAVAIKKAVNEERDQILDELKKGEKITHDVASARISNAVAQQAVQKVEHPAHKAGLQRLLAGAMKEVINKGVSPADLNIKVDDVKLNKMLGEVDIILRNQVFLDGIKDLCKQHLSQEAQPNEVEKKQSTSLAGGSFFSNGATQQTQQTQQSAKPDASSQSPSPSRRG